MSEFQEWYDRFEIENINPNELSANTFGSIVWDYRQSEVKELKAQYAKSVAKECECENITSINENFRSSWLEARREIKELKELLDLAMGELSAILPEMYWLYKQATNEFINKTKDDSSCVTIYKRARATREEILKRLGESYEK